MNHKDGCNVNPQAYMLHSLRLFMHKSIYVRYKCSFSIYCVKNKPNKKDWTHSSTFWWFFFIITFVWVVCICVLCIQIGFGTHTYIHFSLCVCLGDFTKPFPIWTWPQLHNLCQLQVGLNKKLPYVLFPSIIRIHREGILVSHIWLTLTYMNMLMH